MIAIRSMVAGDEPFIVSGWSASLRTSRDVPLIPMDAWAAVMRPIVAAALQRPGVQTLVAAGADAGVLAGFVTFEAAAIGELAYVYYVYVARPFRRFGVARDLLGAAGITATTRFGYACRTRASWQLRDRTPNAIYDPFRARRPTSFARDPFAPRHAKHDDEETP